MYTFICIALHKYAYIYIYTCTYKYIYVYVYVPVYPDQRLVIGSSFLQIASFWTSMKLEHPNPKSYISCHNNSHIVFFLLLLLHYIIIPV